MKTFYYFVCLCAFSLSAGYAGTVDVTSTSSTREAIPVPGSNTDQLVLHSDSFDIYTVGEGNTATYQSLKAVAGSGDNETPANANFATGTLVIDANAQSGTVTGMSAETFSMNHFNLIVQNTAEDNTATVNIDINKLNVLSTSTLVTQTQTFSFVGVNAVLNTSNATISNGFEGPQGENTSTLSVDADSKLTWNGNGTFNKYGKLDLKGSMYLNTGKITFNEGSELLADSGASFHISGISSIAVATSLQTFIFFPILSTKWNWQSGKRIANGIPGKPPPVPKSIISVPGLNWITSAIPSECRTWCSYKLSISFLEMTLILEFQS